jgi:Transposase DDE domain
MHTYQENLISNLNKWLKRKSRKIKDQHLQAALTLLFLDLQPASEYLMSLYSKHKRRPHYDPVCMLRALILMILLGFKSYTLWVKELRAKPRLTVIAGFASNSKDKVRTPSVGCFYDFVDRLIDGKYQKTCQHYIRPSKLKKGKHLRNIANEKETRQKQKETDAAQYDSITRKLKDELIDDKDKQRPDDLLKTLEDILISCAIIPSAKRGMLGDTSKLNLCGDGSALPSGANSNGKPSCDCHKNGIYKCNHDRYYSDATANWGYDSYRECYYFGHSYYQHIINYNGHDLPMHVSIASASETDFTQSMKDLDRLNKALKEHALDWGISHVVYDAGHDSLGNYEYLMENHITPVIALNPRKGTHPSPSGSAQKVNDDGIPVCKSGMLMRRHYYDKKKHKIVYNCPVKRPNGKREWVAHTDQCPLGVLCQTDSDMGPTVSVRTQTDPRLYPPLSRNSSKYEQLMDKRSCCERSNSTKKVTYHLGERVCRSETHYLVRLYLVSIIEHARAWLAEEKKLVGDDPLALIKKVKAG